MKNPSRVRCSCRPYLPSSVQAKLHFRAANGRPTCITRPLGNVNAAMRDLDLSDEEILQLVEQRTLIGFNIAVEKPGRSVLRILTHSLHHFREHHGRQQLPLRWPEIVRLIFPATAAPLDPYSVTGLELTQALNCSRGHITNLAGRYFETLTPGGHGRGRTPRFKISSVETWLKSRLL